MREYLSDIVIIRRADQVIQVIAAMFVAAMVTLALFVVLTGYAAPGSPMTTRYNPDATLDSSQVDFR